MVRRVAWLALLGAAGCSDATGAIKGGEPIGPIADAGNCSLTDAACQTWTYLYGCYFGPTGVANCSALPLCHGNYTSTYVGAQSSGFVCGSTKDDCWHGMTHAAPQIQFPFAPIVQSGATSIGGTLLWKALHKAGTPNDTNNGVNSNNMPLAGNNLSGPASYSFTTADHDCLDGWVKAGAKNN
jgi:hypothetical protein